ncbi:MAG: heme-binding protein [Alteromonadaceae bacterium]|nr:heme-binding protein [Alteromonadaceae bacterium]
MTELTLQQADCIIDGALAKARELNTAPMAAIVLDKGGNIVAFKQEDGASILRFKIAQAKAWGSIGMLMSSRKMAEMAETRAVFVSALGEMSEGKIAASPGGVLIENVNGELLGAIGVSGDLPDLDEQCSFAGIESSDCKLRS